jgi:transcriptional regulator with XRE-family HTH domain
MHHDKIRIAIRKGCERKKWSVMDLAARSEVSPEAIRRYMMSRGEVSTRVLVRLLKVLDVDLKSVN